MPRPRTPFKYTYFARVSKDAWETAEAYRKNLGVSRNWFLDALLKQKLSLAAEWKKLKSIEGKGQSTV